MTLLPYLVTAALFLALLTLAALRAARRRRLRTGFLAANIAEGTRECDSLVPDVTIPARYLLAKRGSDTQHFTLAGAGDRPIGVCEDQSSTAGVALPGLPFRVNRLGLSGRTKKVAINSNVNQDDYLVPAAGGYAQTLPTAAGTYWVIGIADEAGAASGVTGAPTIIEFIGCLPYAVTVS